MLYWLIYCANHFYISFCNCKTVGTDKLNVSEVFGDDDFLKIPALNLQSLCRVTDLLKTRYRYMVLKDWPSISCKVYMKVHTFRTAFAHLYIFQCDTIHFSLFVKSWLDIFNVFFHNKGCIQRYFQILSNLFVIIDQSIHRFIFMKTIHLGSCVQQRHWK